MLVDEGKIVRAAREVIAGRPPVAGHWRNGILSGAAPVVVAAAAAAAAPLVPPVAPRPKEAPAAAPAPAIEGEPISMPFGDLTVSEGRVVRWIKSEGDQVVAGEMVAEVETDKAVVEIEAPVGGTITQIAAAAGTVVKMGERIGTISPS